MTVDREIQFRPAFHRCDPNPSKNFGIGSVQMLWILRLDGWAMTWDVFTGWELPDEAFKAAVPNCTHPMHRNGAPTHEARGGAVDWHSPVPLFDDQQPAQRECKWLGGPCYLDTGYLIGDELFNILRTKGGEAAWDWLAEALTERRESLKADDAGAGASR